jgi:hypothetical protein
VEERLKFTGLDKRLRDVMEEVMGYQRQARVEVSEEMDDTDEKKKR